jgi:hypothetical protein
MKTPAGLVLLALSTSALSAEPLRFESAESPASLVELFTSEGCSSCPPADAWIGRLKNSPELWKQVVPVVFHVDYWDNLGWPDRFASPANSERQRRYAAAWHNDGVYTPGLVLNGREWRNWRSAGAIPPAASTPVGRLQVTLADPTHAQVIFTPAGSGARPQQVEVALLGGNLDSEIKRGENSGRKLRHQFVVLQLATAPLTATGQTFTASLSLPEKTADAPVALAAWVSAGPGQPSIQATGGWLKRP